MGRKRNAKGQFTKGDTGGPGRQPKQKEQEYWRVAKTKCTLVEWGDIISKAIKQALSGDDKARKFIADIMIGNPHKLRQRDDADRGAVLDVASIADVVAVLDAELRAVQGFELDTQRTVLVAKLAHELVAALQVSDLEERIAKLEAGNEH